LPCGSLCNSSFECHFASLIHLGGVGLNLGLICFDFQLVRLLVFLVFSFSFVLSLWWEFVSTSRLQFKLRNSDLPLYSEIYSIRVLVRTYEGF
jgi:hypothetical protein